MDEILLHHAELPADVGPAPGEPQVWDDPVPRAPLHRDRLARLETRLGLALLIDCARAAGRPPPGPADLWVTSAGKPCWRGGPQFSISHTGGHVACALAVRGEHGIGLDIEPVDAVGAGDLRLVATAAEMQEFVVAGLGVADLWTSKEAVIKAAGATLAAAGRVVATRSSARLDGVDYRLIRADLGPDLSCTLASRCEVRLTVVQVSAGDALARCG